MLRIACLMVLAAVGVGAAAEVPAPVGARMADFGSKDLLTGKAWNLADPPRDRKATVVVFLAHGCPVASGNLPKLAELHRRFKDDVSFVAIYCHPSDIAEDAIKQAKENKIAFPVIHDAEGKFAKQFQVDRVPTAYVLDSGFHVRYMGRVDDQFAPGVHKPKATTRELYTAIDAVVDGRPVRTEFVAPAGCKLQAEVAVKASSVTYHKEVARVIQAKCQTCHRPGEAAPFALMSYRDAKSWAAMIKEVVADQVMPPWHADAKLGHFSNDRRLTDDEKKTLISWVDAGCPEGNPEETPAPKTYTTGWRLPKTPDLLVKMTKPVPVPAQYMMGAIGMPYQYVQGDKVFTEDTWITAMEVRPDFRAALHHIIVYVIPKGKKLRELVEDENFSRHLLAAYVPGDEAVIYPEGYAKKIPAGAKLLFELHYTPNGKAGVDQSSIGLITTKTAPKFEVKSDAAINPEFAIPPGEGHYSPNPATLTFDTPVTLLSLTPHMHLRGKAFRYELVTADGKREVLLNVPKYDFNWQVAYILKTPRTIPVGSRIVCKAWFDNSEKNPFNPDPKKQVTWGNQTWEEMMIGFVEYTVAK
ncbi:MAG: redoxin domain-containing protein [Fimbriiglobus sp.]